MKKALASLLAAGMAASLLAGCGGSSSTAASTADTSTAASTEASSTAESDAPLEGEITFWHSFTQGARMEAVQKAADKFMEANPGVKINIETYSWGDFNTKWNAGLTTGDLPDMSTAQGTGEVVEMMNADVLTPIDDMVDDIGRDRFSANALADMTSDGATYGVPYYSHAQVIPRTALPSPPNLAATMSPVWKASAPVRMWTPLSWQPPTICTRNRCWKLPATTRTFSARSPLPFLMQTAMRWSTPAGKIMWSLWLVTS